MGKSSQAATSKDTSTLESDEWMYWEAQERMSLKIKGEHKQYE